ncbi:heme lyase CcmF/NrfE family subunit [Photobacterium jeanii]|nr:heme lyase CcmF/NrfE family subunit [Photobacterium jeanii]
MLAEYGHFALILGFCCAVLTALLPLVARYTKASYLNCYVWPLSYVAFAAITTSVVLLAFCFAFDDFSVAYVAHHSNSQLPVFFKVAAVWGGHEGSFLFWVFSLSGWAALVGWRYRHLLRIYTASNKLDVAQTKDHQHFDFITRVLAILAALVAVLALFTLLASNPFERLLPVPLEGRDLNPMLQDVGLIFHPPMLYLGYVGFAVTFAFAVAALSFPTPQWQWAAMSRSWTLAAWSFLTGGIALGSWWAYYELGWGGWWFWDPVENASLLPWLTATALLHSLIVTAQRRMLASGSLLLAIFTFSLSLLGTFIVRSGVLTSVHAFALDPTRGLVLLAILAVILVIALTLYAVRGGQYSQPEQLGMWTRATAFLVGNSLFAVATLTVMLGTFYPMVFQAFGWGNISVGAPYFNTVFTPISLMIFAVMGIGVLMRLRASQEDFLITQLLTPLSTAIIGGVVLSVWIERGVNLMVCAALICALWVTLTAIQSFCAAIFAASKQQTKQDTPSMRIKTSMIRWRSTAMLLAHVGVAVAIVGATLVSHYSRESSQKMGPGDHLVLDGIRFEYVETEYLVGANFTAEQANIALFNQEAYEAEMPDHQRDVSAWNSAFGQQYFLGWIKPQRRHYTVRTMNMSEPGIRWWWHGDVYITLGEKLNATDYAIRIQHKPFVRWLWLGAVLMVFGGSCAVVARWKARRMVSQLANENVSSQLSPQGNLPQGEHAKDANLIWKQQV